MAKGNSNRSWSSNSSRSAACPPAETATGTQTHTHTACIHTYVCICNNTRNSHIHTYSTCTDTNTHAKVGNNCCGNVSCHSLPPLDPSPRSTSASHVTASAIAIAEQRAGQNCACNQFQVVCAARGLYEKAISCPSCNHQPPVKPLPNCWLDSNFHPLSNPPTTYLPHPLLVI